MILFALEAYREMAAVLEKATGFTPGCSRAARFENRELYIDVQPRVAKEDCFILGSIGPPDEHLLLALLLAHTLKKEGAHRVTAIFPYLAYARHDKNKPGESLATAWVGMLAQASGIDQIITIDVHSERARKLFPIPVVSLSPAEIFAAAFRRCSLQGVTIVAPDEGALRRCRAVQAAMGATNGEIPYFEKHRTEAGITHSGPIGRVNRQVLIIDDILDTGGTVISACEKLAQAGVEEISIAVTHGLFTGDRWKKLWQLGVKRIFSTDSVALPAVLEGNIVQLSITPLLEKELCLLATI
ncbi:MAG TPA: ribose-phosphate diphosphokinase [Bryobacteraceae bacterium]|jgi:ribose-phosphate pyrophosphokinase